MTVERHRLVRRMEEELNYIECATKTLADAMYKLKLIKDQLKKIDDKQLNNNKD